jgi:hypothetical protein
VKQTLAELVPSEMLAAVPAVLERALSLPWPIVIGAVFAPTLIALGSRTLYAVFSAAVLDCAALALLAASSQQNWFGASALWLASVLAGAYGFHHRARVSRALQLERGIAQLRDDMGSYLVALDRRAQMVDEVALSRTSGITLPSTRGEVRASG